MCVMAAQSGRRSSTWDNCFGLVGIAKLWSRETWKVDPHHPTPPNPPNPVKHPQALAPSVCPRACQSRVKTVCRSRSTLRSALVQVKQPSEDRNKKGVVYEVPCEDCECVYIGETSRTLEKCLSKHNMQWRNTTLTMGVQPTLGTTNTKWTGRLPRQQEWKGTRIDGSPTHAPTAAYLQPGLWSGHQFILAIAAWQSYMLLTISSLLDFIHVS